MANDKAFKLYKVEAYGEDFENEVGCFKPAYEVKDETIIEGEFTQEVSEDEIKLTESGEVIDIKDLEWEDVKQGDTVHESYPIYTSVDGTKYVEAFGLNE